MQTSYAAYLIFKLIKRNCVSTAFSFLKNQWHLINICIYIYIYYVRCKISNFNPFWIHPCKQPHPHTHTHHTRTRINTRAYTITPAHTRIHTITSAQVYIHIHYHTHNYTTHAQTYTPIRTNTLRRKRAKWFVVCCYCDISFAYHCDVASFAYRCDVVSFACHCDVSLACLSATLFV